MSTWVPLTQAVAPCIKQEGLTLYIIAIQLGFVTWYLSTGMVSELVIAGLVS